ncbi:ComF family protein [Xylella taiwanensis]|uniref:ComF family protein n=1 Tax=Xylella taiwanensis TaxID=1444770 RepID=Z9JG67_9GAMM|nr:ComF family protein [Xylella taiwanensis]AXI82519.1 competence protein ComF [Xylella taiwanensis]EWS77390.1 competence protein ComF [Xylella taiwanensis]MCD8455508.1 ComF family protein [Xylella taiwanensis]MCD8457915.1 ComF family protein [Xylella taiwanensis]MCD8460050.1 ComF family protein [Xylella taiwanensis]
MKDTVNSNRNVWAERLLCWLLPSRCLACDEPGHHGKPLCTACQRLLPWMENACLRCAAPLRERERIHATCGRCLCDPPPLETVHAAFLYHWPINMFIPRFKFHQDLACGRLLADNMATAAQHWPRPQALVPVSLHHGRLRARGYDQALELARGVGTQLGLPCLPALRRVHATRPQSELDASKRRSNLHNAFIPVHPVPAHVALVDDVMTTGATLHAAARALRHIGVTRIDAWICARVP